MLRSLGLEWRARLLMKMLNVLIDQYNGEVPCNEEKLKSLPGVGNYIARAVLIFGCNELAPLLDTNTVRIAGRVYGVKVTDGSRRSKKFEELVLRLVDRREIADSYYALLDLGATVCTARSPKCEICPLKDVCLYYKDKLVQKNAY